MSAGARNGADARCASRIPIAQLGALCAAVVRELSWGLRLVSREVEEWRGRAATIPDPAIREDALSSLESKRGNTDGAALFWTLPDARSPELLRLLVTYEIMCDFLDSVSERGAAAGLDNGRQLHLAITEALDPEAPISDYYRHHPWQDDGGYLRLLVELCRAACQLLPSYLAIQPTLICAATRAQVQGLNHELDPELRDSTLRAWVAREFLDRLSLAWYELSGSASTWISVLALLALASEPGRRPQDAVDTYTAYFWVCLAATVLDSYVDEAEDLANGDHSYFAHYPSKEEGLQRAHEIVRRATQEAQALRNGHRHAVIVACMVSLYLSKDSALELEVAITSQMLLRSGGPLAMLLGPVLRGWRTAYSLRGA
jgi:tetraprenyl-beta-curcumene synthase